MKIIVIVIIIIEVIHFEFSTNRKYTLRNRKEDERNKIK